MEVLHVGPAGDGVVPGRGARHPARGERKGSMVIGLAWFMVRSTGQTDGMGR
jgi:hypothetical protein